MIELVKPSIKYKNSFIKALDESQAEDGNYFTPNDNEVRNDFESFIKKLNDKEKGIGLPEGWVPSTTLFLVDGDEYIGRLSIRHKLTDTLMKEGGHIGYDIRPSKRKMGYGTEMLRLALPVVKNLGIDKALITCNDDNIGSIKVIENNGGVLQDKIEYEGKIKRRYWINLA